MGGFARIAALLLATCLLGGVPSHAGERQSGSDAGAKAGQQFDCDQLATLPDAPMSVESCKQMMGAAQAYQAAARNPAAARPGDESISCEDIATEMRTLQGVGLSDAARQENATAAKNYQAKLAKQQAEMKAYGVGATAAVNGAAAADAAATIGSGGLVQTHAAEAAQQAALAQGRVMGEKLAQERRPDEQRLAKAVGGSSAEMGRELQANPRYARLVQLAIARNCREPEPSSGSPRQRPTSDPEAMPGR
jgi:hypothetical protein